VDAHAPAGRLLALAQRAAGDLDRPAELAERDADALGDVLQAADRGIEEVDA
jgi:hypothetical protein